MAANRERRQNAGKRAFSLTALEQIRAARSGQLSRAHQLQLVDEGDVYEEMTEEEFRRFAEQRRMEDSGFVENDLDEEMLDDDVWDDSEEGKRKREISRVNRQQRGGRVGGVMPVNDHVASVFLTGRVVKPGEFGSIGGSATEDQEDLLRHYLGELADGTEADEETERRKRQRLIDTAMFGQDGEVREKLDEVFESVVMEDGSSVTRLRAGAAAPTSLNDALFAGSSAVKGSSSRLSKVVGGLSKEFSKPLPRLSLDDDGNLVDDSGAAGDMALDDDLLGEAGAAHHSFGIADNLPDLDDPTFTRGGQAKRAGAAASSSSAAGRALPPTIKEVTFASGERGVDWFSVSEDGRTAIKVERGNVIAAKPSEKMEGVSPVYAVKVERAATAGEESAEASVTSETYDELMMFWYDASEQDGSIYLFGKALLPDKKSTTSCCVRVMNMERNLFVLPRARRVSDPDDELHSLTDEPVSMADVHAEVKALLQANGISRFKSKVVEREYVFDRDVPDYDEVARAGGSSLIDSDDGVPRVTKYLKVVYAADKPTLDRNVRGHTFSRVFGTKSTPLELFLLKRNLMGPCWITIKHIEAPAKAASWAKFNFQTSSHKNVAVLEQHPDPPLFSVLSLSLKTVLNASSQQEVVMASLMLHEGVSVEGPTANETDVSHFTLVTKLPPHQIPKPGDRDADHTIIPLPLDFEMKVKQLNAEATVKAAKSGGKSSSKLSNKLELCANERALLSSLLVRIHNLDPDVLVGHDLHGIGVDVLLERMRASLSGQHWTKLGRLIRSRMPPSKGKGGDGFSYVDRGVGAGRLLLDTMVSAKEFLPGQKMYSLSYLAETQLKVPHREVDCSLVPQAYKTTPTLLELVKTNENDAFLQLSLMFKLVMLPLSKQLTNLCGNMWSRSLRAARAERVEFLLLHDFHRSKFIIPEKYSNKERKEREAAREEAEKRKAGGKARPSKNKPQYAGGLVLEPKRGFYDKYVLLLDFNSLYPSIIQEFNICFSTVKHWQVTKPGELAQPPPVGSESGHLPKVIKRLVQRRRNVKDMLKKESNPAKRQELDIRQKALKLVANSMYGCLGFSSSRFYAEPLAALITAQGRDILQSSVDLTNSLNANVIYGDTDSIMVYSNETDLAKAIELGRKIKGEINKRHRVLEIDIDGVFKNMLLLRKKKYAALKIVEQSDGTRVAQREVKGLDLVRRDWCPLSRDIGLKVLAEILSGAPREEVVEKIHAHLMKLRDDLKNNLVSLDKFIITKGLTKNPRDYTDAKNMPHVKVALDLLAKGKAIKSGDFIPYVICRNDNESASLAARAYDPAHVVSLQGGLELDVKWYLTNQVLPPVARLIGPIEETNAAKVAYALGLDPKAFHSFGSKDEKAADDDDDMQISSQQDDEEKFKSAAPLWVQCPHCQVNYQFPGVFHKLDGDKPSIKTAEAPPPSGERKEGDADMAASSGDASAAAGAGAQVKQESNGTGLGSGSLLPLLSGLKCPNSLTSGCPGLLASADDAGRVLTHFTNRINGEIRRQTQAYYTSFYRCNDSSCGRRMRDLCVAGNKCIVPNCKGRMEREFSATQLYLQLQYFRSLFDVERALDQVASENARRKSDPRGGQSQLQPTLPGMHANVCKQLHAHLVAVLRQSAYYWISPAIFNTKISAKK